VKPGDLVRIDESRPTGHVNHNLIYCAAKENIFIVDKVELVEDPLGPTGELFVTVVDPTDGGRWVIDGNILVKIV
jgi:hypothetical protein